MANKTFNSRMTDYEVFCGAFIRNIANNTKLSPACVWKGQLDTKASTSKLEDIMNFMIAAHMIKMSNEKRHDKKTYQTSERKYRDDSTKIRANLEVYFKTPKEKRARIEFDPETGLLSIKEEETAEVSTTMADIEVDFDISDEGAYVKDEEPCNMEEPIDILNEYGYNRVTGEFTTIPEEPETTKDSREAVMNELFKLMDRAEALGYNLSYNISKINK
jgi:hypothetical protein